MFLCLREHYIQIAIDLFHGIAESRPHAAIGIVHLAVELSL